MIDFAYVETDFQIDEVEETRVARWIEKAALAAGFSIHALTFVFTNDEYLWKMNVEWLEHDDYTDVITFDSSTPGVEGLSGDIYMSVDRVRENAETFNVPFEDELSRVMAHGVLHLCGWDDLTDEAEAEMRAAEDEWLALR